MPELDGNEILNEANFLRNKELELELAKIEAGRVTDAQQKTRQVLIWLTSSLIFLLGVIWTMYDFNLKEEIEITAREAAKEQAAVERAKQHTEQAVQQTKQEQWKAEQLRALIEIVRNSKTDDLARDVLRQLSTKK